MQNVIMLNFIMLNIFMLNFIMLNVIMLSVVVPRRIEICFFLTIVAPWLSRQAVLACFVESFTAGHQEANGIGRVKGEPEAFRAFLAAVQAFVPAGLTLNMDDVAHAFSCHQIFKNELWIKVYLSLNVTINIYLECRVASSGVKTITIMTLSIKDLFVTLSIKDAQHNNAVPLDWASYFSHCYAECHYA